MSERSGSRRPRINHQRTGDLVVPALETTRAVEQRREVTHDNRAGQPEDDVPQERPAESQRPLFASRHQSQSLGTHSDRAGTRLHQRVHDEPSEQQEQDDQPADQQGGQHPLRTRERGGDHQPAGEDDRKTVLR